VTPGIVVSDTIGLIVGAVLTLLVFSYILGDNPLYRLALHIFVGALVGYSFGIVVRDVLVGMVFAQVLANPSAIVLPLVLGILLLFKGFAKQAYVGNYSVAFLVGVGTAVALGGVLLGTLVPQIGATGNAASPSAWAAYRLGPLDALFVIGGTVLTLMAFAFATQKQTGLAGIWHLIARETGRVGRVFLIFALAVAFAGALTASCSIFIGRIQYLIRAYFSIVAGG